MKLWPKGNIIFKTKRINNAKCEIASIGVKKGFKIALCGIECINLTDDV